MLELYFNKDHISEMSFKDFEKTFKGNANIIRSGMTMKEAFKSLGGKMRHFKKEDSL